MAKKITDTTEKETKKVLKAAAPAKKLSAKAPAKITSIFLDSV